MRRKGDAQGDRADPGLLRALAVAWAVRPDLGYDALPGWLWERLNVRVGQAELDATLEALQAESALDSHGGPQEERLSELVDE